MDYEKILLKAQQKAQKIASKVERELQKNNEIDPSELSARFSQKLYGKKESTDSNAIIDLPAYRLTYEFVKDLYVKTGLQPGHSRYWFYDDLSKHPLLQISCLNKERTNATPVGVLCILLRNQILEGTKKVPDYIGKNSEFVETSSNRWVLGQIAQLTGLSCSYILGFNLGYDGNKKPHPNGSKQVHLGYEDGLAIRKKFIEESLLFTETDPFATETNPNKISELVRVGYYEEVDDNNQ